MKLISRIMFSGQSIHVQSLSEGEIASPVPLAVTVPIVHQASLMMGGEWYAKDHNHN